MPISKSPDTTSSPDTQSPTENKSPKSSLWGQFHIPTLLRAIIPLMSKSTSTQNDPNPPQNQPQPRIHQNPQIHPYLHPNSNTQRDPPSPPARDWFFVTSTYHNTHQPRGNLPEDPYSPATPTSSGSDSSTAAARRKKAKEEDTMKKLEYVDKMLTAEHLREEALATVGAERTFWDSRREEICIRAAGGRLWSGSAEDWSRMAVKRQQARGLNEGEFKRGKGGEFKGGKEGKFKWWKGRWIGDEGLDVDF